MEKNQMMDMHVALGLASQNATAGGSHDYQIEQRERICATIR